MADHLVNVIGNAPPIRYGCICSGISAPTLAAQPLGWQTAFFSEIEKFPRAVLRHRYPEVPLHGDFTTIQKDTYGTIDALVGGTPCQSFSVAGKRLGLDDPRGNLALEFVALAIRLDALWLAFENVPGLLSSGDPVGGDFAGFIYAATGYEYSIPPADGRMPESPKESRTAGESRGACLTLSISEWPRDADVCSLSDIVETGDLPRRYYLSPKACAGILRRAGKRGRELPRLLRQALEHAARTITGLTPDISSLTDSGAAIAPAPST